MKAEEILANAIKEITEDRDRKARFCGSCETFSPSFFRYQAEIEILDNVLKLLNK